MSDSLLERFATLAPADGRADWSDVVRRARPRSIRVPIALAAGVAALAVTAPAVALVALLKPDDDPPFGSVMVTITPFGASRLTSTLAVEVPDRRVRTVVLAFKGRPQRRQAVGGIRIVVFRLSKRDFGRCGELRALDRDGSLRGVHSLPRLALPPHTPPTSLARRPARPPKPC